MAMSCKQFSRAETKLHRVQDTQLCMMRVLMLFYAVLGSNSVWRHHMSFEQQRFGDTSLKHVMFHTSGHGLCSLIISYWS